MDSWCPVCIFVFIPFRDQRPVSVRWMIWDWECGMILERDCQTDMRPWAHGQPWCPTAVRSRANPLGAQTREYTSDTMAIKQAVIASLYLARHCSEHFTLLTPLIITTTLKVLLLSTFYRWGNWGLMLISSKGRGQDLNPELMLSAASLSCSSNPHTLIFLFLPCTHIPLHGDSQLGLLILSIFWFVFS